ncbi:MAG: bacillithiol biosynthesis cysteine-adding enzyme BshC [Pyrinomonadaceae bacterium]|nr:bacillithiol biosynthesis cysteine-adding enzyme BshC [Pyrinomonadaceae bacterium]
MKEEIVCPCPSGNVVLQTESLSFTEIPHQSKLFRDYQNDPESLRKYYPLAVNSHTEISKHIDRILSEYKTDRAVLCDVLEEANRRNGATDATLKNIEMLRDDDCVAVVSGQQAGLFTGPMYTIYKALSAVKMTECLRGRGFKAVPVFWIATEDHDFEEVSKIEVISSDGKSRTIKSEPKYCYENLPVGYVKLDESIKETIDELFESLPRTEFTDELREMIENSWTPGEDYGDAFARLLTKFLGKFGLIVLCPLDVRLKKLATPIYVNAIRRSDEIVEALRKRSDELESEGYHAQVLVGEDYFPLFWQAKDRTRHALKKSPTGTFKTRDIEREFTIDELADLAAEEPQRFSPSVVLRSVVQDYLLPTVCYFGGAAEIAYFAQSSEVYRLLDRPVTPIFHRQSFTIVESKHGKTLDKYELEFRDVFEGIEVLLPKIVEQFLNREMAKVFAEVEENINKQLNRLDQNLFELEPTLADSLANRRRKILYHISNIRSKFHNAQIRKDETINRRIETAFASLYPHKALQERSFNVSQFVNRHGVYFFDWLYQAIDLDDDGHRIIFL